MIPEPRHILRLQKMNQPRIGLALGGGVVRGIAHIGVLAALEQAGIQVDMLAGSSAGSLIGVLYCTGMGSAKLREISRKLSWFKLMRPIWPRQGFVSFDPLERWLVREYGNLCFEDLPVPFAAVATDLNTGEIVVLDHGPVALAVRASCSVAGAVTPAHWEGRLLCDGNFSNSVPVSVLRQMGADFVIGVDVFQPVLRSGWWGPFGPLVAGLEILVQRAGLGIETADCLIAPDLAGCSYLRFSQREILFEKGLQATLAILPALQEQLISISNGMPV